MSKYNVLWLDDQFDSPELEEIADKAEDKYSITLNGFKSGEEGIEELEKLEKGQIHYDAILLDARFFLKKIGSAGTEDLKGLREVWSKLDQLEGKGISLPRFILSGQTDLSSSGIFKETYGEFYSKHNPDDINKLLNDICEAADKRVETQIRHQNPEVFSIFPAGYLSAAIESQVMVLLKSNMPSNKVEMKAILANIRSIHESCFSQLKNIGVIPRTIVKYNNQLKHLSGNSSFQSGYNPTTKVYQNSAIENLNETVRNVTSLYIHNLDDATYNDYMISNYTISSLIGGILEILLWFKKTYEENK